MVSSASSGNNNNNNKKENTRMSKQLLTFISNHLIEMN